MSIVTVGLDLAKQVFQVHGVDEAGRVVVRRQLRRDAVESFFRELPPCLVGMEACGTAHHWARRILAFGHRVRLIPPARVKAYVAHGKKNDATDAAAIAEAVTRPHMAFVPVKGEEQQAVLMLHRTRDLLVRQRTMLINGLRGHLAEFGIVAAQGRRKASALIAGLDDQDIPDLARAALRELAGQIETCDQRIVVIEQQIVRWHKNNEASRRLATIPGIGPITASVLSATVTDPSAFKARFSECAEAVGGDEDGRRGEQREYDSPQPVLSSIQALVRQQPCAPMLDNASDLAEPRAVGFADLADVRLDPVAQAEPAVVGAVVSRIRVEPADGGADDLGQAQQIRKELGVMHVGGRRDDCQRQAIGRDDHMVLGSGLELCGKLGDDGLRKAAYRGG